jgi:hypothetical protein
MNRPTRPVSLIRPATLSRRAFAASCIGAPLLAADAARPSLRIRLGSEQLIAPDLPWPYLFQSREGTTVIFGHVRWPAGGKYPIHYTARSFDQRRSWQEWKHGPEQGRGPVTEGACVQLRDGRILLFDVHAEHTGNKRFEASYWVSDDGFRTLQGPRQYSFLLPEAAVDNFDDRGEPISRMYVRRSILQLPDGDLLAPAYGHFESDRFPTEYEPKMNKMRSFLLRSRDGGGTWSYVSTIASDPVEQEGFGEPVLVRLNKGPKSGRLLCQMRTGRENPIYQCESDDEGRSWTRPTPLRWVYSRFGRSRPIVGVDPDLIEMQDGTLVMSYGHKPDYREHGNYVAFSLDHGRTWIQVTALSHQITSAYTGVREVAPNELYVVYSGSATHPDEPASAKYRTYGRSIVVRRNHA